MKTLVAIPCMDMVHTEFFRSVLGMKLVGEVDYTMTMTSLIYDARNQLAERAVKGGFDRVLWLDSDMVFDNDLFKRLHTRLDEGYECVSGLYFARKPPYNPVIYKNCYLGLKGGDGLVDGEITPINEPYTDYPGDIFEVAAHGFGATMMETRVIKEVMDNFGHPFSPEPFFGEDLSFCRRVSDLGHHMYCDPTIKLGHIGYVPITEETYLSR